MKRIIATLICATMCISMLMAFSAPVSADAFNNLDATYEAANKGDLLYSALFGLDFGCYKSHEISRDERNTGTMVISEDRKMITYSVVGNGSDKSPYTDSIGRWWYGGEVEGLTLGEGYSYTIKYKIKNDNSGAGTGNNGFYINTDKNATTYTTSYGEYGNLCHTRPFISLFKAGAKTSGMYLSDGSKYIYLTENAATMNSVVPVPDADGFVDCQIEIVGLSYYFYINGNLFDATVIPDNDYALSNKLAIIFYTYSSGGALKDVEIYKGLTLTPEPKPVETTTEEPTTTTEEPTTTTEEPVVTTTEEPTVTTTEKPTDTTVKPSDTSTVEPTDTGTKTPIVSADPGDDDKDDSDDDDKGGCGGIATFVPMLALTLCSAVMLPFAIRKKH